MPSTTRGGWILGAAGALLVVTLCGCNPTTGSALLLVYQGSTPLTQSQGYSFGSQPVYTSTAGITFTVKNVSSSTITLDPNTPYTISGANAADFAIYQQVLTVGNVLVGSARAPRGAAMPRVAVDPGSTATFSAGFTPSVMGAETASVTVNTDQGDFSFAVDGTGAASGVFSGLTYTDPNTQQPATVNSGGTVTYPFLSGSGGNTVTFTITNTGAGVLGLAPQSPTITSATGAFSISSSATPLSVPPPNGTSSFSIADVYVSTGTKNETVTLLTSSTNSADRTFTFTVTDSQS